MTDQNSKSPPQQPRSEPEIIPPGATHDPMGTRIFIDENTSQRIYVGKIGPLGVMGIGLTLAVVIAVVLVLLLGAFLLWIPIVAVLVGVGLVAGVLRNLKGG
ncbi:MAG: hypothetical protein HXX15_20500 [Rhodopseudomonas sp.]|uniref:hypothetical protein n=1 Tax=Rhodopseudomonas sp. TaxID=1078 RepID=UPI0017E65F0D|nr:hypothetical protein [Rhodopseudomonas sp.]NVN88466.1 hypothetical protein [Rhodopseudomonas sp.]